MKTRRPSLNPAPRPMAAIKADAVRAGLIQALRDNRGCISGAARDLDLCRVTVYRLMQSHGITWEAIRAADEVAELQPAPAFGESWCYVPRFALSPGSVRWGVVLEASAEIVIIDDPSLRSDPMKIPRSDVFFLEKAP